MRQFSPPTIDEGPLGGGPLFYRMKLTRGISVLKIDGVYYEIRTPSQDEIALAQIFYQGGNVYTVTATEALALEAAGYLVDTL
jgi:hypothetical protein